MGSSPYRKTPDSAAEDDRETGAPNRDLLGVFSFLWLVSVLRVAYGVARHQTFDAELTVAFLIAILLPVLMKEALRDLARRLLHGFQCRQ